MTEKTEKTEKPQPRVIKKYSNRRLYDARQSRYITLEELKEMVLSGEEFTVVTAKNEDITSQTLLAVLLSSEVMGRPVFSEQNLRNMVMFMHGPMRGPVRIFFEQCMPMFAERQREMMEKFGPTMPGGAELENLAMLQGSFVRQLMERYVCRSLENYMATQKNMEQLMHQSFPFPNFFKPEDGKDEKED